jgi:cellulose synthase/poly-beta-1,6-N-acetylglucosamine synthase-like glycosyltransferase
VLPSSPSLHEKYLFLNQERLKVYTFGLVSTLCVLAGNAMFIIAFPFFIPYVIVTGITLFYLALSYLVGLRGREFNFNRHRELGSKWFDQAEKASVDIYLPICREKLNIVCNTWEHVHWLKVNHPNVHVYVLDDGRDDNAMDLAHRFGFNYIRRENNELKKAGNLRNAFKNTHGQFIAIFDADFCPTKDFLIQTLPYFFEDQNVAIVQTPQYFDNNPIYGWVRNGAGAVQELFYRLIQVNRNTFNGAICVGTNAVYRRAHLAPFGGTAPIPYSEDVHTGFQLIQNGHRIQYLPINLAHGICPDTAKQFFTQQYRWALGSISLMFTKNFWTASITRMQRVCYLTGMFYYVSTGIGAVTYFIPSLMVLLFFPKHMHWFNLLFSVPSLIYTVGFMRYWMKLPMTMAVLRVRALSYYAHLFALKDRLFNTLEEWKPTGAEFKSDRYGEAAKLFTFVSIAVPVVTFMLVTWRVAEGYPIESFILLIGFTLFNAAVAIPVIDDL